MELSVSGFIVVTLASLVSASPYGYGVKSGAVAKAEASAGAGAFGSLPVIPLAIPGSPGYSGSFSKSSSSSFASSSASSSSSSSSFSYSGAGSNVIPGYGTNAVPGTGCGGACQHGGKNELGSTIQGLNVNGGPQGHNFAIASATAGAGSIANIPGAVNKDFNRPCKESNCYGTSSKNENNEGSTGNSQSESGNKSNDYAVNIAGKPHSSGPEQDNKPHKSTNGEPTPSSSLSIPESSDSKISNENTESSDCESPDCDAFVPHAPTNNNNNFVHNKPSSHLETPYKEQGCTTHNCNSGSPNSESGKLPSSYNVPILGNQQTKTEPCTSGKCQVSTDNEKSNYYSSNQKNVVEPSNTLQVPTGPLGSSPCTTRECLNPSYHPSESAGSNIGPSYHPSTLAGSSYNPSYQPTESASFGTNPSYKPSGVTGSDVNSNYHPSFTTGSGSNPSYRLTGPTSSNHKPSYPIGSASPSHNPSYQSSGVTGSEVNPSYHFSAPTGTNISPNEPAGSGKNPSYQPNGEIGVNPSIQPGTPAGSYQTSRPAGSSIHPTSQPGFSAGSDINQSYHHSTSTGSGTSLSGSGSGITPADHSGASVGSYNKPSYQPTGPVGSSIKPTYQPSLVAGSGVNPSYKPSESVGFGINDSFQPSTPDGGVNSPGCKSGNCAISSYHTSGSPSSPGLNPSEPSGFIPNPICTTGNCANPSYQPSGPITNPANQPNNFPSQVSTSNQITPTGTSGCSTPNCHESSGTDSSYENGSKIKPTYPGSGIVVNSKPSKTDSEVLLSNKGNQIYTGGFGGPTGILSVNSGSNNKDKPSANGIFVNPSHNSETHNTPNESKPQSVPQTSNVPNPNLSLPNYSQQVPASVGHQHFSSNNLHSVGSVTPNVDKGSSEENKPKYTGGFGGPAGLLKPNEYTIPSNTPKPTCSSGSCGPSQVNQVGSSGGLAVANAVAAANANAVSYSGGFGGPPGLLKPYDEGKVDKNGQNIFGKHSNSGHGQNVGSIHNLHPQNLDGVSPGSQASAVASASATAGSYGHNSGGCNTGCSSGGAGHDLDHSRALGHSSSGVKDGISLANASASAKSVAGASSYAQGRSVASASAHASAGASSKGGYTWR